MIILQISKFVLPISVLQTGAALVTGTSTDRGRQGRLSTVATPCFPFQVLITPFGTGIDRTTRCCAVVRALSHRKIKGPPKILPDEDRFALTSVFAVDSALCVTLGPPSFCVGRLAGCIRRHDVSHRRSQVQLFDLDRPVNRWQRGVPVWDSVALRHTHVSVVSLGIDRRGSHQGTTRFRVGG